MNENNHEAEQSSKVDVKKTRYEGISNHDKENGERAMERLSCSSANFTAASMFEEFLPLKDLEISTPLIKKEEITFTSKLLGQGSFGTVTQGKWKYTDVAVKTLRLGINSMKLCREIAVMDKIRHPNVIFIMVVAYDISHCYIIVMEFFDSISLREFIFNPRIKNDFLITEDSKHEISKQICTAITYMHETVPKVIHQDLKPENILINDTLSVKICDMGHSKLSKMPANFKTTTGEIAQGTPPYMAPELLLFNQRASTHSDV
ncbi:dual specificity protein kinase shkA-like [Nasonia vitripennis]|uniref:Protein kinase domain-containing protein n=1 Tax=Nasonia vitripennis TaxID=7425 RepID=A0A7M7J8A4_NASVI|nr:dual specificity protein kinase shkA-like [Nasonia vitripennis]